jgi:mannose-1-phosphate guanylyltransferase
MNSPTPWLLIMAGGSGTRFWPRSRKIRPKQLLQIVGEESLLSATINRFRGFIPEERIVILSTVALEWPTRESLPGFRGQILAEPEGKNTAPALVMAMTWLRARDPNSIAVVVPADHWIADIAGYQEVMQTAMSFAQRGTHLVTIGITPSRPETGFGYIRSGESLTEDGGVLNVERFVEKPKLEVAETMIQDSSYLWNSGMFVWSVQCFFENLSAAAPELVSAFQPWEKALLEKNSNSTNALNKAYAEAPVISIDYALFEKAKRVAVVPGAFDWNDLGSFQSLYDLYPACEGGSARAKRVMAIDSIANLVDVPGKTVALLGVTNMMIVDVGDVLLVAAKEKAQDVKKFVERLRAEGDSDNLL